MSNETYRPSALANLTPSAPDRAERNAIQEAPGAPQGREQGRGGPPPQGSAAGAQEGPEKAAGKTKKHRRNFYSTEEDHARTEAARKHTMGFTDYSSYTAFVEAAVNKFTRELEAEYNDGRPWS